MLNTSIIKRILSKIRTSYEDILLTNENIRFYSEYSSWLNEYFELSDSDKINILKKFERSQTASIIYAMRKGDKEIRISQLGIFYIKQTTLDYYRSLNSKLNEDGSNYEEVKQSALEECRSLFIQRANNKKHVNDAIEIKIKGHSYY